MPAHPSTTRCGGTWLRGSVSVSGTFDDADAFDALRQTLQDLDKERGTSGNHVFYLSIPPAYFSTVTQQLDRSNLSRGPEGAWQRASSSKSLSVTIWPVPVS